MTTSSAVRPQMRKRRLAKAWRFFRGGAPPSWSLQSGLYPLALGTGIALARA